MKMRVGRLCALCLAVLLALPAAGAEEIEIPELLPAAGVETDTAVVFRGDYYVPRLHDAWVAPYAEELSVNVSGRVGEVLVKSGDTVKKGDLLVSVDLKAEREQAQELEETLAFKRAQNDYTNRLAQLDIAILENDLDRLMAENADEITLALKKLEIEQAETDLRHARELQQLDMENDEIALAGLQEKLADDGIYAPFDGCVASVVELIPGDPLIAYKPVLVLADDTRLHIVTEFISDYTWSQATGGARAMIGSHIYETERMPVDVDAYISASLRGETGYCSFELIPPEEGLKDVEAGMYCALILFNDYAEDQLLIPSNAVISEGSSLYVYAVGENGEYEYRPVRVKKTQGCAYAMVLEGLEEGEMIYVTDQ